MRLRFSNTMLGEVSKWKLEVLEDSILLSISSNIKIFSCESRNKEIFGIEFVFIWRSFEMMPRFDSSLENFLESI